MSDTSYDIHAIRNVALIAHGGGGKSTLAETLLFNGRAIAQRGVVEKGSGVMSNEAEEVAHGLTILPHVGHFNWRERQVNLIDTPGFIDFLELTRGALYSVGGAVLLFSGLSGVKPENERLWQMTEEAMVPVIGFINKMDQPRAQFIRVLGQIEQTLGVTALPVTIPIGAGEDFRGIIDLIPMTAWSARDGVFTQIPFPEEMRGDADYYRRQLVEKVVEADDLLLDDYLEREILPSEEQLHRGLKEAVLTRRLLLIFCGSAKANIGVRALANGIVSYLPSPVDKAAIKPLVGTDPTRMERQVVRHPDVNDPFSALVVRTAIDPFAGKHSIIRVFSGQLQSEQEVYNGTQRLKEKGGRLFRMQGREMIPVSVLRAGEFGAIAKLVQTKTGDTLCAIDAPIHYQRVQYLEPLMNFAVDVDEKSEEKASSGLARLTDEDPTLRFHRTDETHEMILSGMGQTHLSVALERLKRKYGVTATLKTPKVAYQETITRSVRVQGKLKKQSGGHGQYGDCWLEIEPSARGSGFLFEDHIVGGVVPKQFVPSVEKGIREAMESGVMGGYPVVDVKVRLVDGSYHSVDSSDHAFKVAGSMAFKKGMAEADPVLLEPIMRLEVIVLDDRLGDIISDLNSRRGRIVGVIPRSGGQQSVQAEVPMAELLDYGQVLNGITSGRGLYTMRLETHQIVPSHTARKVLESRG
ncbi:MAG: elongation factor G [Magnetococcales bacterium]|nr:elongation factor G [Magnetococcales bacterium]